MQPTSEVTAALSPWQPGIFSLVLYTSMVLALIAVLLFLASWLGEKKENPEKVRPFFSSFLMWKRLSSLPGRSPLTSLAGLGGWKYSSLFLYCFSVFSTSGKKEGLSGGQQLQKA
jgi:hypothetical protein